MSYVSEVLADSPALYWRLGESSLAPAADASGNSRTGTYNGSPTFGATGLITGDSDTAIGFDGVNDQVIRSIGTGLDSGNVFTVEAWFKTSVTAKRQIVCRWDNGNVSEQRWTLQVESDGKLTLYVHGSGYQSIASSGSVADGAKHHAVATCDGTTLKLYLDGTQVASATLTVATLTSSTAVLVGSTGGGSPTEWFTGTIDEVAIYTTALSSTRVAAHYNATLDVTVAGSLATETDTALAGGLAQTITGSLATETDTALSGTVADYDWKAQVRVGSHEWEITSTCSIEDESPVYVLEGLRIGWAIDESRPWPTQPNPVQATVLLLTDDVVNLEDVAIGTTMSVVLVTPASEVLATFHGRVAQLTAGPLKRGDTLYMQYQVAGVDFTVDLAETPIALPATGAQSADDRFATIVDAAAAAGTAPITPPAEVGTAAFEAITASTTNAGTLLGGHLDQVAVELGDGLQRNIVVPVVDTTTDELERFDCLLLDRTVDAALLPGTFDLDAGTLVLTFPDMAADGVVDACTVQLDTVWTRLKYRAVNRVIVTADAATAEASRPGPPVRLELTSTLTDLDALQAMADLYLPDVDENNGWVADPFTLRAYLDLAQIVPAWFPDHREDPAVTTVYVQPIAIVGIPSGINLAGDLVYAGQLSQAALVLNDGRLTVTFALRRQLPLGVGDDAATWAWAQTEFPTTTWDDIDPGLSWYEARLGKAT